MHQIYKYYLSLDSTVLIKSGIFASKWDIFGISIYTIYPLNLVLITRKERTCIYRSKTHGLKQITINHKGKKQPLESPLTSQLSFISHCPTPYSCHLAIW